MKNCHQNIKKM